MSCANTNWPEYMMGNSWEKIPVSQKNHVQVGNTLKHAISYARSSCYRRFLAKLPDTTDARFVSTGELNPREDAAKIVQVHREVGYSGTDSKDVGDSIGAEALINSYYQHDDCGFLDEISHQQIDFEICEECMEIARDPAFLQDAAE